MKNIFIVNNFTYHLISASTLIIHLIQEIPSFHLNMFTKTYIEL